MIKLYRNEESAQADAIEAEFHDMILGYERLIVTEKEAQEKFGPQASLPVITNNEKMVSGEELPAYVEELRDLIRDWQKFQVDACYVDDKGKSC